MQPKLLILTTTIFFCGLQPSLQTCFGELAVEQTSFPPSTLKELLKTQAENPSVKLFCLKLATYLKAKNPKMSQDVMVTELLRTILMLHLTQATPLLPPLKIPLPEPEATFQEPETSKKQTSSYITPICSYLFALKQKKYQQLEQKVKIPRVNTTFFHLSLCARLEPLLEGLSHYPKLNKKSVDDVTLKILRAKTCLPQPPAEIERLLCSLGRTKYHRFLLQTKTIIDTFLKAPANRLPLADYLLRDINLEMQKPENTPYQSWSNFLLEIY